MFFRLAVVAALAWTAWVARASEPPLSRYEHVIVEPAKTSVYIATVSISMEPFTRASGGYEARYTAKVFPWAFYNDAGKLSVDLSEEMLRQLERGEAIEFTGRGLTDDGAIRRVEGKATPLNATSGKLKVRVFYSKRIELIFNTTYRFEK
jgi:hypothetical protein